MIWKKSGRILVIPILLLLHITLNAQKEYGIFYEPEMSDSATWQYGIKNTNFFKNNEYFNNITEGYTLVGYFVEPYVTYHPVKYVSIHAGIHALKYSGRDKFSKVLPVFRIAVMPGPNFKIIMGKLYGTINHELSEPILQPENYFINNNENGIQFLVNRKKYRMDLWLNWEQFILWGSPFQEKFTAGTHHTYTLISGNNYGTFKFSFQGLVTHKGGQIDSAAGDVQSIANYAPGLIYMSKKENRFVQIQSHIVSFADISPVKKLPFIYGFGTYTKVHFSYRDFSFIGTHWYGNLYITTRGEPLFQSISIFKPGYYEKKRALLGSEFYYQKNLYGAVGLRTGFVIWYDLYNKIPDYNYALYLVYNLNVLPEKTITHEN